MAEKPTGGIQAKQPELKAPERPGGSRWVKPAIVLAMLAALGWGFFLGYEYLKYRMAQQQTPGVTAPTTSDNTTTEDSGKGLAETVETQNALEAYRPYLEIYDVSAGYEDPYAALIEGDVPVPVVHGKIKNNGDKTLSLVEITAYFYDANGQRISEQHANIVSGNISLGGLSLGENTGPLRPGYIHNFTFIANNVPSEWSTGEVECEVTAIKFGG